MHHWKFLILGITGDLSKRKILPGLAQFAELRANEVSVELIGYSRSTPDDSEIERILDTHTSTKHHKLDSITHVQGEYSDSSYFSHVIESLQENERLVVYIATPPVVFLQLLETFCPFNAYNLDIIIEKPFGQNLEEAQKILAKVDECRLNKNVHYCDHYLFKNASYLPIQVLHELQEVKDKKLQSVSIQALEEVSAKGRGGYYDANGALKDMLPAHLYSLLNLALTTFTRFDSKYYSLFDITSLHLGQYESYLEDVEKESSSTETYFFVKCQNSIRLSLESGKNVGVKKTAITLTFEDGSIIEWNIDPEKTLVYESTNKTLQFDLKQNNKLDHTNMFEDLLHRKNDRFFVAENILTGWEMYEKIREYIAQNRIKLEMYEDRMLPHN